MKRLCLMSCVSGLIFMLATGLQASLSDGLVAYYPFNGNANDESGNGNHGSPVGGATWTTGVLGGAVHLNGSAYINVPDSPSLDLPGGMGTISAFIKVDPSSDGCGIVSKESSSSFASQIAYEYRIGYEGTPQGPLEGFGISDGTTANWVGYTGTPLKYSLWHHVAVTWSGPGGQLVTYRDGVQIDQSDQTISTINNISEPVRIGAFRWNVSGIYRYMTGNIDEVRIYDRALSAVEISELASLPEPTDPPIADAGDDVVADANEVVILDGSASYDPDGEIIRYTWKRLPDDVVIYSGKEPNCQTLTLGRAEEVIELTVTDNYLSTATDTVRIISRSTQYLQEHVAAMQSQIEELQRQIQELQALVDKIVSWPPIRQRLEKDR